MSEFSPHVPAASPPAIAQHPYLARTDLMYPSALQRDFSHMVLLQQQVLDRHAAEPIDILVGDDVSARVPARLTHNFLRLAQTGGQIATAPGMYFLASGIAVGKDNRRAPASLHEQWRENLRQQAACIMGGASVANVLVITEIVASGGSVRRLKDAFTANGAQASHIAMNTPYLRGHGSSSKDRQVVGVEKWPPAALSRRHQYHSGREAERLRLFLDDYATALYETIFQGPAPAKYPRARPTGMPSGRLASLPSGLVTPTVAAPPSAWQRFKRLVGWSA